MERTSENIIQLMEESGIMMRQQMTAAERLPGLLDYQAMVLKLVFNDDHAEEMRLKNVAEHFQDLASEKGYSDEPVVQDAIEDMGKIAKEIAIEISGANGEKQVAKQLRYVRRNIIAMPNICLSDDEDETELDQVVITSSGIMILEVKNYKHDITISESGYIYGPCQKKYTDKVLGEQMNAKRYLLKKKLEKQLEDAGIHMEIHIETRVVFTDPTITVTDLYKQERYCFRGKAAHEIDNFTSRVCYSQDQMKMLASAVEAVSDKDKTYDTGFDFDRIRHTFAQALVLLEGDPKPIKTEKPQTEPASPVDAAVADHGSINEWAKACACFAGGAALSILFSGALIALGHRK